MRVYFRRSDNVSHAYCETSDFETFHDLGVIFRVKERRRGSQNPKETHIKILQIPAQTLTTNRDTPYFNYNTGSAVSVVKFSIRGTRGGFFLFLLRGFGGI